LTAAQESQKAQNWLLISFDQWRGDWLLQPWLHLPHLKRLASEGWHLDRCYTASPACVPARASWLTGLRPSGLGVTANQIHTMPADAPSFVRELRDQAGYATALVGKTHWTPHESGLDLRDNLPLLRELGFDRVREIAGPRALAVVECELTDRWRAAGVLEAYRRDLDERYAGGCVHTVRPSVLPEALYPDLWLTGVALEELAQLPQDRPWLLWVNFPGPHEPFDVPQGWRGRFPQGPIPEPEARPSDPAELERLAPPGSELARKLARWPEGLPADALQALRADYADHLALLDAQVGELLAALGQRADGGRTAVSVCSDHGELLGDWGLLLKGCFLEGAIRSLFVHRPPRPRAFWRRLRSPGLRAYGLSEALWAAASSVRAPQQGSFGTRLRRLPRDVVVEFAAERLVLR
jgi:choline-sulfatase